MATATQEERIQQALAHLKNEDADGFMSLWTDDVVWQVGGSTPFAGTYRGREEVGSVIRAFFGAVGSSYTMDPIDVLADDRHVAIMFQTTGAREGKTLDMVTTTFITTDDTGTWNRCWYMPSDQQMYDEFFS